MATGLRFTDGTTTVTLSNGSTGYLTEYDQGAAPQQVEQVTDKASVLLLSSLSTVQATVVSLNRLFYGAYLRRTTGMGPRVFVERDLGDGTWWRSEVVEAVITQEAETLDTGLAAGKIPFEIVITRSNWWEGASASVPLTNANGTDNTSGLAVYNHDDAGATHDNWVSIDGVNDITGDLPAPCKLTMINPAANAYGISDAWLGQNWTDLSLTHILEAEDGVSTSDTADATCSGGNRVDKALTAGAEAKAVDWNLSATFLSHYQGQYVRPILRLAASTNLDKIRFRIKITHTSTGNVYYTSEYTQPGSASHIVELPAFRLPPFVINQTAYTTLLLQIYAYNTHTSNVTLQMDFLQLMPLDGWRKYSAPLMGSYAWNDDGAVVDDSVEKILHFGETLGYEGGLIGYGDWLYLRPGKDMKLYFMFLFVGLVASIDKYVTVKMTYRPRRLTI